MSISVYFEISLNTFSEQIINSELADLIWLSRLISEIFEGAM